MEQYDNMFNQVVSDQQGCQVFASQKAFRTGMCLLNRSWVIVRTGSDWATRWRTGARREGLGELLRLPGPGLDDPAEETGPAHPRDG